MKAKPPYTTRCFVTGMPRGGTSMMFLILARGEGMHVLDNREKHLLNIPYTLRILHKYILAKQPFGYFEDFKPEYHLNQILKLEGDRVIFMLRDPRDVLVSKHNKRKDEYWVDPKIVYRCYQEYLNYIDHPQILFTKYEDLVTQPTYTIHSICSFLGIPYKNSMLDFHKDERAQEWESLNTARPISIDSIGNYKKKEHRARIESLQCTEFTEMLEELGYDNLQTKHTQVN